MTASLRDADRKLVRDCQSLDDAGAPKDPHARAMQVWRMLAVSRANVAIDALHPGDDPSLPAVGKDDADFLAWAGRIGAKFVTELDEGSVGGAYEAWFDAFQIGYDALGNGFSISNRE